MSGLSLMTIIPVTTQGQTDAEFVRACEAQGIKLVLDFLPASTHTPISEKSKEEMTPFEREYPW
jgi:hypothetical protein